MQPPFPTNDHDSQLAELHTRVAAIQSTSARVLRANGADVAADRAERFALHARDALAWPKAVTRMYSLAREVRDAAGLRDILDKALDGAIIVLGADFGNIQLVDQSTKTMRIVCHRGFTGEFLDHFAVVGDEQAACGRAARARSQAVIDDVNADPGFAAHRAIAASSGFRAVQSTPLIDTAGRLRGVLSTHFRRVHRPPAPELRMTEIYGRIVADAIALNVRPARF
jgi:GAF domain-containing protein